MVFRVRRWLCGIFAVVALAACSPNNDKDETKKAVEATSPSSLTGEQVASREAFADLSLPPLSSDAHRPQKISSGGMLEQVNTSFEDGAVKACFQLRTAVSDSAASEAATAIKVEPAAAGSSVRVEDSQLCVRGLSADQQYNVTLLEGLRLRGGAKTNSVIQADVHLASLPKSVGFKGGGFVLAKGAARGVQVVSTNVTEIKLEMVRVPERSLLNVVQRIQSGESRLTHWDLQSLLDKSASVAWKGSVSVKGPANETASTVVPIQNVIAKMPEGAYALMVRDASDSKAMMPSNIFEPGREWDYESTVQVQWLLHTNLAASAAKFEDGMSISVRSLDQARPVVDANVELITRNNDIVYKGRTGSDGRVLLPKAAIYGQHANSPSHLLIRHEGDFAWLNVNGASLDLSAFDVGGRTAPKTLDAYVYTDRGIYRPAETVHVNGLVRDPLAKMANVAGVNLLVHRPNGSLYVKRAITLNNLASFHAQITLPNEAPRGAWQLSIVSQRDDLDVLGRAEIDVQDFVPERLS